MLKWRTAKYKVGRTALLYMPGGVGRSWPQRLVVLHGCLKGAVERLDRTSVKGVQPRLNMSMTVMWRVTCDQRLGRTPAFSSPRGEGTENPGSLAPTSALVHRPQHTNLREGKWLCRTKGGVQSGGAQEHTWQQSQDASSQPPESTGNGRGANKATHTTRATLRGLCAPEVAVHVS